MPRIPARTQGPPCRARSRAQPEASGQARPRRASSPGVRGAWPTGKAGRGLTGSLWFRLRANFIQGWDGGTMLQCVWPPRRAKATPGLADWCYILYAIGFSSGKIWKLKKSKYKFPFFYYRVYYLPKKFYQTCNKHVNWIRGNNTLFVKGPHQA